MTLADSIAEVASEIDECLELIIGCPNRLDGQDDPDDRLEPIRPEPGGGDVEQGPTEIDAYDYFIKAYGRKNSIGIARYVECIKKLRSGEMPQSRMPLDYPNRNGRGERALRWRLENKWKNDMTQVLALCNLGIRLYTLDGFRDYFVAVRLFKLCATRKHKSFHESELLYGASLVYGSSVEQRNILKGMKYLHRAAYGGMGLLAYFILGSIFEQGCDDCQNRIDKNLSAAKHFYRLSANVTDKFMAENWEPEIDFVRILLRTPEWHTLAHELSTVAGERFNWTIAAQAFLFGAAAGLSGMVQPDHYTPLLLVLPLLGIALGVFSLLQTSETLTRNAIRGDAFDNMVRAKLDAYHNILEKTKHSFCKCCGRPNANHEHWIVQLSIRISDACILCGRPIREIEDPFEKEKERYLKIRRTAYRLNRLSKCVGISIVLLSFMFLAAWIAMLVNETISHGDQCGDWWSNTCQGSTSVCISEARQNVSCALLNTSMTENVFEEL